MIFIPSQNKMIRAACLMLAVSMLSVFSGRTSAGETLTVSDCTSGITQKKDGLADEFASRIACREGWKAKVIQNQDWNRIPSGAVQGKHVNLVEVRFGNRLDFIAFVPGTDGVIEHEVRVPAMEGQVGTYWFAKSPGRSQIPRNAPTDLVAEFANSAADRSSEKPVIAVNIQPWQGDDSEDASSGAKIPEKSDLEKLMQISCAAVYKAGYRPAVESKAKSPALILRFRKHADSFDISASYIPEQDNSGKKLSMTMNGISLHDLYEGLTVMACNVLKWNGRLSAFAKPGSDDFTPMAVYTAASESGAKPLIVGLEPTDPKKPKVIALTPGKSDPVWSLQVSPKIRKNLSANDDSVYFKNDNGFTRINLKTGKQEAVSDEESALLEKENSTSEYEVGGLVLKADANGTLTAVQKETGKILWKQSVGDFLLIPPVILDSKILVISKANRIMLLNPDSGAVIAEKTWSTWITAGATLPGAGPKIALFDTMNRLSLLGSDLKPMSELKFPFPMHPLLFISVKFSERWNSDEDDLVERGPALITFDRDGHIYIFMMKNLKGRL